MAHYACYGATEMSELSELRGHLEWEQIKEGWKDFIEREIERRVEAIKKEDDETFNGAMAMYKTAANGRAILEIENKRLREALKEIASDPNPSNWKPFDAEDGYSPYKFKSMAGTVSERVIDTRDDDDIHGHGVVMGEWRMAKKARAALEKK